jgi:hypothetical protein
MTGRKVSAVEYTQNVRSRMSVTDANMGGTE